MKFSEIYSENKFTVSFEVFPPKEDTDGQKTNNLLSNLSKLKEYNPAFVSLTYGAGGSLRLKTFDLIKEFQKLDLSVMPHFTCIKTTHEEVSDYLQNIKDLGIDKILALRGDIPEGENINDYEFKYAVDLIKYIKENVPDSFSIAASGYCEGHANAENLYKDFKYMLDKIDAGAEVIFTQLFFNNSIFLKFRDKLKLANEKIPLVAGIMPIISIKQMDRITSMSKVSLPADLCEALDKYKDNPDDIKKFGVEYAVKQCNELIRNDALFFHFYTLNLSRATSAILDSLDY